MISEKNDSIITTTDIESQNLEVNNTSSDSLSQNSVKCKERIITENPRRIMSFLEIINLYYLLKKRRTLKNGLILIIWLEDIMINLLQRKMQ